MLPKLMIWKIKHASQPARLIKCKVNLKKLKKGFIILKAFFNVNLLNENCYLCEEKGICHFRQ